METLSRRCCTSCDPTNAGSDMEARWGGVVPKDTSARQLECFVVVEVSWRFHGFEVSWLVHVLGVQAVASPHSSCLADVSFGTTPPHRASMSLPAFAGSHGVLHRLDRVSMLRSCRCGTSWSSRQVWARSPVTWWCDASPGSSQLHSPSFGSLLSAASV